MSWYSMSASMHLDHFLHVEFELVAIWTVEHSQQLWDLASKALILVILNMISITINIDSHALVHGSIDALISDIF